MNKFLYFAGFAYIALCGAAVIGNTMASTAVPVTEPIPAPTQPITTGTGTGTEAEQWFASIKPFCNPVEVDVRTRYAPAPATPDGIGYSAACFALAGKIDRARATLLSLGNRDRFAASNIVFNIAHPVADAGDDRASGQMMELVLEFWPANFMARYHAGMSAYALGADGAAERHLRMFLDQYNADDGFTGNARQALKTIQERSGGGKLRLRPIVERDTAARP